MLATSCQVPAGGPTFLNTPCYYKCTNKNPNCRKTFTELPTDMPNLKKKVEVKPANVSLLEPPTPHITSLIADCGRGLSDASDRCSNREDPPAGTLSNTIFQSF